MTELKVCVPEVTMEKQLEHIGNEFEELVQALAIYRNNPTMKNRAEILFEALDLIACVMTFISMMFSKSEVRAGTRYVNSKNYVRHYLRDMADGEVWQ